MRKQAHSICIIAAIFASTTLTAGCQKTQSSDDSREDNATVQHEDPEPSATTEQDTSPEGDEQAQSPSEPAHAADDSPLPAFSLKLAGKAFTNTSDDTNVLVSPWSIHSALTLVAAGAGGDTWTELSSFLGYPQTPASENDRVIASISTINQSLLPGDDSELTLTTANRAWIEESATEDLEPNYQKLITDTMGAAFAGLNFQEQPEAARKSINTWVAEQTNDKIEDLLPPGSIDPNSQLVLTNAVYFLADWKVPFRKEATTDRPFTLASGESVQVPTMRHKFNHIPYWRGEEFEAVLLDYNDDTYAMALFLPVKDQYDAFETLLTDGSTNTLFPEQKRSEKVIVQMPKTTIRWSKSIKPLLQSLGVTLAFTNGADFSRMFNKTKVSVSDVFHETFMKIDEQGTEAAAATGAIVSTTSVDINQPRKFILDRPYYAVLVHKPSTTPLFLAKINDPRSEE